MSDCLFCKIAAHEIPSDVVFENERVIAFKDISPAAAVHVLIVPKEHHANVLDGVDGALMAELLSALDEVVKITGIKESGFRCIMNTGDDAGQTVHHLHMHVLGGQAMGEGLLPA